MNGKPYWFWFLVCGRVSYFVRNLTIKALIDMQIPNPYTLNEAHLPSFTSLHGIESFLRS
jgi:hypothetical protein